MTQKMKILLIDDEVGFTELLKLNLEATGKYEVCVENDPRLAVNTALHFRPNLILLDIIMPRLEGPDIALEMRRNAFLRHVPVIYLTATVTLEEMMSQKGRIGGNQFVAKPSTLRDLLTSIESNLVNA